MLFRSARSPQRLAFFAGVLSAFAVASYARPSLADGVHYDIGFGVGPAKRFLSNKGDTGDDAALGGRAQLHADVAVLPLLRLGLYAGFELSPPPTGNVREMFPFGFQAKVTPPIESDRFKVYGFLGFGYDAVYTHSFSAIVPVQNAAAMQIPTPVRFDGVSGSFFEVPFGVGGSYRLRKPWELFLELRATAGIGFGATLYNFDETGGRPGHSLVGKGVAVAKDNDGEDAFGLALVFGIQFDK
jgi:hypothetical protein